MVLVGTLKLYPLSSLTLNPLTCSEKDNLSFLGTYILLIFDMVIAEEQQQNVLVGTSKLSPLGKCYSSLSIFSCLEIEVSNLFFLVIM